jgi:hypothetical protein
MAVPCEMAQNVNRLVSSVGVVVLVMEDDASDRPELVG